MSNIKKDTYVKGKFITVSGLDGAGKTTLLDKVEAYLIEQGKEVLRVREPGGTPTGEILRDLIKGQYDGVEDRFVPMAELLAFYASRVQLVEKVIKPALAAGKWVLADRFDLDSLAYQGFGLGMVSQVISLSEMTLGDFEPDLTLVLDINIPTMRQRAQQRGSLDYIEKRGDDFFTRARNTFLLTTNLRELEYTTRWKNVKVLNGLLDPEAVFTSAKFALKGLEGE